MGSYTRLAQKYVDRLEKRKNGPDFSIVDAALKRIAALYTPAFILCLSETDLREIDRINSTLEESMITGDEWAIGTATRHWERTWWRLLRAGQNK